MITHRDKLVSVVILTKNGGEIFENSIKALFTQNVTFRYEVIIIDSGSTDGTLEFLKRYPVKIFKVDPKGFSFGPIRDFGFSKAGGDVIVTISQDVVAADNMWLESLTFPIFENNADIVQGRHIIPESEKVFFWEKIGFFYFTSEGKDFIKSTGGIGLSCTNLAVKRNVWEEVKFGSIPMNEDKFLQKKVYEKGFRIIKESNAVSYHGHNYNLVSLIKRCENEGFGWKYIGVKYTFKKMLRDLKQRKWVYGALIRGILSKEITSPAELLFLFIRPVFMYKGNLFNKGYKF